jgi:hypothetical protein
MIVKLMLAARLPRILAPLEHAEASGIAPARHITQFEGHRQLVGVGASWIRATGRGALGIYLNKPMLQISAQTWKVRALEALCSAAVT